MRFSSQSEAGQQSKHRGGGQQGGRLPASRALLALDLSRGPGSERLYRQIRDQIRSTILSGSLGGGMRLPPERELARALRVNRATVARAYQELAAEGFIEGRGSQGTLVALPSSGFGGSSSIERELVEPAWLVDLTAHRVSGLGADPTVIRELVVSGMQPNVIPFSAAGPAPEMLPLDDLAASLAEAFQRWGTVPLRYGPVEGSEYLREALRQRYAPDIIGEHDDVMVVSGATQGIEIIARALVEPGDEVIVEAPGYVGTIQALGLAGAYLIGIPIDAGGIRVDLVESVLERRRIRLIIVQPTFHNPTGATLSAARREHLLWLAKRHAIPVLEDDPYRLLSYDEDSPPPTLKSLDRNGNVIYLSSFSKSVAPGLRLGWIAAHRSVLPRLAIAKQSSDLNSSGVTQAAMACFLASGRFDAHLGRAIAVYRERRSALVSELARRAPGLVAMIVPQGGFHVWVRLPTRGTARQVMALASRYGVSVVVGVPFYPRHVLGRDGGEDHIRLSFPEVSPDSVRDGVGRLAMAISEVSNSPARRLDDSAGILV